MKKICLLCLVLFPLLVIGQQLGKIEVYLSNVSGSEPFYLKIKSTKVSNNDTIFKGIPSDIIDCKIKELTLNQTGQKLYVFYGLTKGKKRIIIFDSNFDKDFSGEKNYQFDQDIKYDKAKEKSVLDSTSLVEIKLTNSNSLFVKPDVYNCCYQFSNKEDSIWNLLIEFRYHSEGAFEIRNKKYKIAFSNSPYFNKNIGSFYLNKYEQPFDSQTPDNPPFRLKEAIFIDKEEFSIDSVTKLGDQVWISYKENSGKQLGQRLGLYATNIRAITMANNQFELHQLQRKYVLLDFWGIWCGPCIELIPRLSQLNEKYKAKGLILISIASDDKNSYLKTKSMIKQKRMNWDQIYDDRDKDENICKLYDISAFPTSILIDPNGIIVFRTSGSRDFSRLEKLMDTLIK